MGKSTKAIKESDKSKSWNKRESSARPERELNLKNTFLIYCEGMNTEPEYFRSFPVTTQTKVKTIGVGRSRMALINRVIELLEYEEKDPEQQIWVVFDRDVNYENGKNEDNEFNEAIKFATEKGINCAYSNDCFELWFVLHHEYSQAALHRNQYFEKLSKRFNMNYLKDGKGVDFAKSLYQIFLSDQNTAIKNAERLHQLHSSIEPRLKNPCTTVYQLVEELNKNLRK